MYVLHKQIMYNSNTQRKRDADLELLKGRIAFGEHMRSLFRALEKKVADVATAQTHQLVTEASLQFRAPRQLQIGVSVCLFDRRKVKGKMKKCIFIPVFSPVCRLQGEISKRNREKYVKNGYKYSLYSYSTIFLP